MFNNSKEGKAEEILSSQFQELNSSYFLPEGRLIVSHIGNLTQDKISNIALEAEAALQNQGITKSVCKKIFNLIIETLQNIKAHATKDKAGNQFAYFIIGQSKNAFTITSGNLMPTDQVEKLREKVDRIKKLDEKALKDLYLQVLDNGEMSDKGGAGLGILTIALKSGNNIQYSLNKIDDSVSVFKLQSRVSC